MQKIRDILYLEDNGLYMNSSLSERISYLFPNVKQFWIDIIPIRKMKTLKELGYYHAEVLYKMELHLKIEGWRSADKDFADLCLKMLFHYKSIENSKTGKMEKVPMGMTGISAKDMFDYLENCRQYINEGGHVTCETPEQFKINKKKLKTIQDKRKGDDDDF